MAGLGLGVGLAAAPWPTVVVVACLPVAVMVLLLPHLLVVALPFAVPLAQRWSFSLGGFRFGPVEALVAGVVVLWAAQGVARRRLTWSPTAIHWAVLAWLWVLGLSLTGATSLSAGLAEVAKWVEVLVVVVLVPRLVGGARCRYVVWAVAAAGVASACLGLYQFVSGTGPAGFLLLGRFMRAYGTFQQPNPFAAHLGLSLPFALGWALAGPASRRERVGLFLASGIMALGIVASWSRGAWLGLAISVALMAAIAWPRVSAAVVVIAVVTSPMWVQSLASTTLAQRFLGMGGEVSSLNVAQVEPTDENWAVVERLAHWQAAWRMFEAKPYTGVGAGNYEQAYGLYALPRWSDPLGHAHNYYLNTLAETGLLGLGAYAALGMAAWVSLRRAWTRHHDRRSRGLILAAVGALAYLTVHSVVDNLYVHGMQVLVGLALAAPGWAGSEAGDADNPKETACRSVP